MQKKIADGAELLFGLTAAALGGMRPGSRVWAAGDEGTA